MKGGNPEDMCDSRRDGPSTRVLAVGVIQFFIAFWMRQTQEKDAQVLSVPPPVPASATPYNKALYFDLSASPVINNASITISNQGADCWALLWLFGTGWLWP